MRSHATMDMPSAASFIIAHEELHDHSFVTGVCAASTSARGRISESRNAQTLNCHAMCDDGRAAINWPQALTLAARVTTSFCAPITTLVHAAPPAGDDPAHASGASSFTSAAARPLLPAVSLSKGLAAKPPTRVGSQVSSLAAARRSRCGAAHKLSTRNAMTTHSAPAASRAEGTVSCSQ